MGWCQEMESMNGKMALNILENTIKEKNKALERSFILQVKDMKVCGQMENNKAKEK